MYRYYNANALNKYEDDCVIRAISCATNKSWDYVYDYLSDIAQYEGTLLDKKNFVIKYLDFLPPAARKTLAIYVKT